MSYASRRPLPSSRPYGVRPIPTGRPPYSVPRPRPMGGAAAAGGGLGALTGALGALGGTLGCLLCLAAIGALGLFACVIALTAYTKSFLDKYKQVSGLNGADGQLQLGVVLLCASLLYTLACRMQRS